MKLSTLTLTSLLAIIGSISAPISLVQAQECPISSDGVRAISCAKIYNATPERVQLSGVVGEMTVETNTQSEVRTGPFTTVAPSPNNSLYPNNVLETTTYAKADLQFNDGSLVWVKPDTKLTLSSDDTCDLAPSMDKSVVPQDINQKLCLLSGSILVITPTTNSYAKSNLSVITDEATIWKPATVYLVSRHPKQERTEVYVFSGDQTARIFSTTDKKTICGINSNPSITGSATSSQSTCGSRLMAGEYMAITSQGTSVPKPFDLPAWVATDSFFAPLRENTSLRELGTTTALSQSASIQPPTALNTIQSIQPNLVKTVEFQQSIDCPIETTGVPPLGIAQLPPPQFNPVIPPPAVIPTPIPYNPPPKPVRGMW